MAKNEGVLYIRYKKNSEVGRVIEKLKKTETNFSLKVRDYILLIRGFEVLKNEKVNRKSLEKVCLDSIKFFSGNNEIAKINLRNLQSGLIELPDSNYEDVRWAAHLSDEHLLRLENSELDDKNQNSNQLIYSLLPKKNNC